MVGILLSSDSYLLYVLSGIYRYSAQSAYVNPFSILISLMDIFSSFHLFYSIIVIWHHMSSAKVPKWHLLNVAACHFGTLLFVFRCLIF